MKRLDHLKSWARTLPLTILSSRWLLLSHGGLGSGIGAKDQINMFQNSLLTTMPFRVFLQCIQFDANSRLGARPIIGTENRFRKFVGDARTTNAVTAHGNLGHNNTMADGFRMALSSRVASCYNF